jgi:threonylcarbamoyladenosine tRNA methylthiotransferase MtaB
LWSRPADDVLAEIGRLAGHGHREIVLTGIHLGHYGRDRQDGWDLARLVRQIARLEGEFRLRLSSLEAGEATHELIAAMAGHAERICPHLHIPLQSGSDAVLRRMGRRWPTGRLVRRCRRIQAALDQPALTTDVMVGFPGETEEDFAATCRAVEAVGFSKLHVFRFSPRPGTPAARMPNRVPDEVQQRRAAELARLGQQLRQRYFEGLAGRTLQVLVEREKGEKSNFSQPPGDFLAQVGPLPPLSPVAAGLLLGTADRYAPVELAGQRALVGRLVRVVAGPVVGGSVRATAV